MNKVDTNLPIYDKSNQIQLQSFKVLPRFVGTWEGNWVILNQDGKEIDRFTSILKQKIVNNQWVQTNQHKYSNGKIENIRFFGGIVGDGTVLFESPDYPYCNFVMLVEEHGNNLIIISVSDKTTGCPLVTETINLTSENQRIRTLQKFQLPNGKPYGFIVVVEQKVEA